MSKQVYRSWTCFCINLNYVEPRYSSTAQFFLGFVKGQPKWFDYNTQEKLYEAAVSTTTSVDAQHYISSMVLVGIHLITRGSNGTLNNLTYHPHSVAISKIWPVLSSSWSKYWRRKKNTTHDHSSDIRLKFLYGKRSVATSKTFDQKYV